MDQFLSDPNVAPAERAREFHRTMLAGAQQARCPVHDVALAGFFATCPVERCKWNAEQARLGQASTAVNPHRMSNSLNALPSQPAGDLMDASNYWQRKYQATQGIRGALRNLWRQLWR